MDLFFDLPAPKNDPDDASDTEASKRPEQQSTHQSVRVNKRSLTELTSLDDENPSAGEQSSTPPPATRSKKFACDNSASVAAAAPTALPAATATGLPPSLPCLQLKGYVAAHQGERDSMQDKHVLIDDFAKYVNNLPLELQRLSYYAVFDGHAGVRASAYCAERMHIILADKLSRALQHATGNIKSGSSSSNVLEQIEKEMKRHLVDTFRQCDDEFLKIASKNKPAWKDGSTATIILVLNDTLYAANVGDSKAIIHGTKDTTAAAFTIELTKEHSAGLFEERQRVQKAGGSVREGRVLGVLEVSRSIGDGALKAHGVIATPDVKKCQLNAFYKYVVLACDGLWKSFSNEEAVGCINAIRKKRGLENDTFYSGGTSGVDSAAAINQRRGIVDNVYEVCCNRIATDAIKRLTSDNVTVVIISIESAVHK